MSTGMCIEVIKPGALTTFQDLGREGYQHLGVPVNGVMDTRSHRLANALVGNSVDEATLEITLIGPTLKILAPLRMVLCGADLQPMLDDKPAPMATPINVPAGATLRFDGRGHGARTGVRTYMAVQGGYQLARVMGSASTFLRGGYGGYEGRALKKGDRLAVKPQTAGATSSLPGVVAGEWQAHLSARESTPVRFVAGREWDAFGDKAQSDLVETMYRIGMQSDRMGYRMEGRPLRLRSPREMLSEAVGFGTIQVPPDGQPIILMADRQTSGGYPKIGHVCAVDLPRLAQSMPGDFIGFEQVSLAEAQQLLVESVAALDALDGMQCGRGASAR